MSAAEPARPAEPTPITAPNIRVGWWQRHGNTAQWVGAIVASIALLGLFVNIALTLWFHYQSGVETKQDEHVNSIISAKVAPELEKINNHIDTKLDRINSKIDELSPRVARLEGQSAKLQGQTKLLGDEQAMIKQRVESSQEAVNQLLDPTQSLTRINEQLKFAEAAKKQIPSVKLANYKRLIRATPPYSRAREWWDAVANFINYQSFLNQLNGKAPDPAKISKPCASLTGGIGNVITGKFSECIIDLDTQAFADATFVNSVIRYRGGYVATNGPILFVNCRFILEFPSPLQRPPEQQLLVASLFESADQVRVVIPYKNSN